MPPRGIGRHAERLEQIAHGQSADEHRDHRAPRGDAREQQDGGADQDGQRRGFGERSGDESQKGVQRRIGHCVGRRELLEGRGAGDAVDMRTHHRPVGIPDRLTRHRGGVGEKCEGTGQQRGVEDVHTRTAEDLLAEDHGESRRQSDHPERGRHRHDHRDQQTRDEETLVDLVAARLREPEFDAQTHDIRDADHRQHADQSVEEGLKAFESDLNARVVAAEEERRHQRHDDHDHRAFHVVAVADVRTLPGCGVGYEEERFERIERRLQKAQLPAFRERGLDIVHEFTKSHL